MRAACPRQAAWARTTSLLKITNEVKCRNARIVAWSFVAAARIIMSSQRAEQPRANACSASAERIAVLKSRRAAWLRQRLWARTTRHFFFRKDMRTCYLVANKRRRTRGY